MLSSAPRPTIQLFGFHLEQSLEVEVLTTTPSRRRTMRHSTIVTSNCRRSSKTFAREPSQLDDHPPLASATTIAQTPKTAPGAYQPPATLERRPASASRQHRPWATLPATATAMVWDAGIGQGAATIAHQKTRARAKPSPSIAHHTSRAVGSAPRPPGRRHHRSMSGKVAVPQAVVHRASATGSCATGHWAPATWSCDASRRTPAIGSRHPPLLTPALPPSLPTKLDLDLEEERKRGGRCGTPRRRRPCGPQASSNPLRCRRGWGGEGARPAAVLAGEGDGEIGVGLVELLASFVWTSTCRTC
jgi:hypothetical protein